MTKRAKEGKIDINTYVKEDPMVKIKKIYIKHFRSIIEEEIETDNFNVFVGLNDSGKSNVLKALDLFFNYKSRTGRFNFFEEYCGLINLTGHRAKKIVIAVTFEIPDQYTDRGDITLTREWSWTKTKGVDFNEFFDREFSAKARTSVLLERITYNYIPAVKSENYFQSLLLEMYNTMLMVANSELRGVTDNYTTKLKMMTSDLSALIKDNLNIESYIRMPEDLSMLFRDLIFETKDAVGNPIKLQSRGDGIRARHIPAILKFIYDRKIIDAVKRSVPCTMIWGYEEPENGVEMGACFDLVKELLSYSTDIQMFITSHSPAFYSVRATEGSKVYLTYKEQNHSKYVLSSSKGDEIDKYMGLMPIIQPHLEKLVEEYQREEQEIIKIKNDIIAKLQEEVEDQKKVRIVLITEGISDVIHLQTAFSHLTEVDAELLSRISYYDFGSKGTLGDKLDDVLKYLSAAEAKSTIFIGVYDRDKKLFQTARGKVYEKLAPNVYRFNIPALENAERRLEDKICIEHYYTNQEIKTEFGCGRLYMGDDFDKFGTSSDGDWSLHNFTKNQNLRAYSIIDKNCVHLEEKSDKAKMATKVQFANYVRDNFGAFNFCNFIEIFRVIKLIDDTYNSRQ